MIIELRVSVIIPMYNSGKLAISAIKSVIEQIGDNFTIEEILIIDDGSKDGSLFVIEQYIQNHGLEKIIKVVSKKNGGASSARNLGLKLATGEVIAFLDSDDIWLKYKLTRQIDILSANKNIGLVYGQFINRDLSVDGKQNEKFMVSKFPSGMVYKDLLEGNFIGTSSVVVRKELIDRIGSFDESLLLAEDYDFWIRLSKHCEFRGIPSTTFIRIFTGKNNLSGGNRLDMYKYTELVIKRHLADNVLSEHDIEYIENKLDEKLIKDYLFLGLRKDAIELIWKKFFNDKYFSKRMVVYLTLAISTPLSILKYLPYVKSKLKFNF